MKYIKLFEQFTSTTKINEAGDVSVDKITS